MKTGKYTTEIIHENQSEKKKLTFLQLKEDTYAPLLKEYQKPLPIPRHRIVNKKERKKLDDD